MIRRSTTAGLTFVLNNQTIASGGDVIITDIGEGADALICMTDLTDCCSPSETKRGEWRFPDGTLVGNNNAGGDLYRTRGTQQVLLHRRNNALGPLGSYCCEVDAVNDPDARICINISKYDSIVNYVILSCTPEVAPSALTVALRYNGDEQTFGMNYALTCEFLGGNGQPSYEWCRNGARLTTQSTPETFSFTPLGQVHSGAYTCTVLRGLSEVTSNSVSITVDG